MVSDRRQLEELWIDMAYLLGKARNPSKQKHIPKKRRSSPKDIRENTLFMNRKYANIAAIHSTQQDHREKISIVLNSAAKMP